ncbi:FAD-binding oxidoreductase [Thermoactinospora rubra]|uniref:FAD-binding oxidoreductase n=1 Tax=Thermoactinospora rubra TaxID=1088767 RepID=UPI000A10C128|nr:FAD-binding oxidoreductase [Thermoactinospora rubra]
MSYAAEPSGLARPGEPAYAGLCSAWNASIVHQPACALAARSAEHVAEAVAFAADRGLRVRVQATGHGALRAASEEELLIDTSGLAGVAVEGDTALIGPGAKWRHVIDAAHPQGLTGLVGTASDVGVVGFSLGGGLSWFSRRYGLACDAIVEAQVVTADGRLRWIDEHREPELFEALRGGGPNFAVVTALRTRLFPIPEIYGGTLFWPVAAMREVLEGYRDWARDVPREVGSAVGALHVPDAPFVPEHIRGHSFARICVCHSGPDFGEVDRLLAPLRAVPGLLADTVRPMPVTQIDDVAQDPVDPVPFMLRAEMLTEIDDRLIGHLVDVAPRDAAPYLLIFIRHLAGMPRPSGPRGGLAWWQGDFVIEAVSLLPSVSMAAPIKAFGDRLSNAASAVATGYAPLNFIGNPEEVGLAFTPECARSLVELKKRYDPTDMFGGDRLLQTSTSRERRPLMM